MSVLQKVTIKELETTEKDQDKQLVLSKPHIDGPKEGVTVDFHNSSGEEIDVSFMEPNSADPMKLVIPAGQTKSSHVIKTTEYEVSAVSNATVRPVTGDIIIIA